MDFSPSGWGRVILWTALGALGCVAVTLFVDSFNFHNLGPDDLRWSITLDVLVPIGLAGPILFFLLSKLRELAIAHELLRRHAATDALTDLLNRGAFTREVEEALADARFAEDGMRGTLLVVDADNFKAINDTYGHEQGDAALRLIASSIRGVLRSADLIGRIGGEEFAVYLPGTTLLIAEAVAERLRQAVYGAEFAPEGKPHQLTVSVGGAVYDRHLPFAELFRLADQQLYAAKQKGRNCIAVTSIAHYETLPAAAA
ncbi:MAG TPA: GGDEF domain-containing protein [Devosia sp.]|uniref:GGDEF domain-containing protein n=1 Tax=Devosia sp. TaxID=1871048 RepID=UPI002DDD4D95|nr:GGDEF domain-containing protein [Devosia sp.]HEV2515776.1 GGDEF domain-containing protein [Devosia sp.]